MNKFSSYLKSKKKTVKALLDKLLEKYEFASILGRNFVGKHYFVDRRSSGIAPASITECGFVARVYSDHRFFEYSFSDIDQSSVDEIYQTIVNLVETNVNVSKINANLIKEEPLVKKFMRKAKGKEYSDGEIMDILKGYMEDGLKLNEQIINVRVSIEITEFSTMYLSKDRDLEQYYTWDNPRSMVMVSNGKTMKYAYDGFGTNDNDEAFALLKESYKKSADLAIELLDSELPKPGVYTIITDPSITGLIAHEAFGHGLEMDQFTKDRAKSQEYMNKPVGSQILSMHDGAAAALSSGTYFFDDEGVLAQDTKIIDNGILIGGICDTVAASILNYKPTGNGRRESYKRKAYTRMTNTFFEGGSSTLDEMIKSVSYGYYIGITNNGMEDPKNWGIQCTALYGREIKDGKFTGKMISPVVMSGYVIDLLMSISMISKDNFNVIGSGSCGKGYKEWVRVADGGASIKAEVKIG